MSEPAPWLDKAEMRAWLALIGMVMSVPPAIDAQLKRDSGVNFFEYSILAQLADAPDRALQMSRLSPLSGGSLSRLSHAASRLECAGLLRRRALVGEPRSTELVLTDRGLAALEAAAPDHVREARRLVFDVLTREQVIQLHGIALALTRAASPETAEAIGHLIAERHLSDD